MSVIVTTEEHSATVTLNRPPTNSLDTATLDELDRTIAELARRDDLAVVVVRAGPGDYFSGGADVGELLDLDLDGRMQFVHRVQATFDALSNLPQVVVAAVTGHALGGGYELALACDIRIGATGSYRVGLPEAMVGLLPAGGGSQRLVRLVGRSRALLLMATAETLDPGAAHDLGLLDQLLPRRSYDDELADLVARIGRHPRAAVRAVKRVVHAGADLPLDEALALERAGVTELLASDEADQLLGSFLRREGRRDRGTE